MTDWLAHTPDEVIAANFGISKDVVASSVEEKYIFQEAIPGCLEKDKVESPNGNLGPLSFSYNLLEQEPDCIQRRKSMDCRFHELQSIENDRFCVSGSRTWRHPGAALASEYRRMAVLHFRNKRK